MNCHFYIEHYFLWNQNSILNFCTVNFQSFQSMMLYYDNLLILRRSKHTVTHRTPIWYTCLLCLNAKMSEVVLFLWMDYDNYTRFLFFKRRWIINTFVGRNMNITIIDKCQILQYRTENHCPNKWVSIQLRMMLHK